MALLSIPGTLDFETVQVVEYLARRLAERRQRGARLLDFSPAEIAAAADRTVRQVEGCTAVAWRGTENAAFGHLIELAAIALESADLIARAAELRARPNGPRIAIGAAAKRILDAAALPTIGEVVALPCDTEPSR
jgi:hypothetical protein